MRDLISRQAVIEINRSYHGQMPNEVNHSIWKEINELPSVQPEIIHCKDCKWYELPSHRITENCVRWMESNGILLPIKPDDFCSRAERRTND